MEILTVAIDTETAIRTGTTIDIPEETIFGPVDSYTPVAAGIDYATDSDSIYTVSQRNNVDWKQLAVLNGLSYPYQLATGQKLKIPGASAGVGQVAQDPSEEDFENLLFGADEVLNREGNMAAVNKDIATVSGMDNLAMQLMHRITTIKGELAELGHPEYGSLVPTFIGQTMTPVWEERILFECRMACESDPRVQYVENSRFYNEGTAIFYEGVVYPINNLDPILVQIPIA